MIRQAARVFVAVIACVLGLLVVYAIAAILFALFPAPGRLQQANGEPAAYLCASLAHSDIVLPSRDVLADWQAEFPEVATADLSSEAYLAFGWGDLRFFLETPTWSDLKLSVVLGALAGLDESALRVLAVNSPEGNPACLKLRLDEAGRKALIAQIKATLLRDGAGRPRQRPGGDRLEAYYLAVGRYGLLRTCNQWAADALGAAGLPHALFAPFSFSVTQPLQARGTP